jgi:penicillin-binding protein 1C
VRSRGGLAGLAAALAFIALAWAIAAALPAPALRLEQAQSTAVFDRHGHLLRLTLASDQQYRVWTSLEAVSPEFLDALLLHEDRRFYSHPGVDAAALARAATRTLRGSRQGGSTITMQLARLRGGLDTRTVGGKLRQALAALWLELRYSKREILEAHVNLLPYGRNIQGIGTASLIYFGKPAAKLTLAEALTLVLIPQSPARRDPGRGEPAELAAARERLRARWVALRGSSGAAQDASQPRLHYRGLRDLPFEAPHLVTDLLASAPRPATIRSTLDLELQKLVERRLRQYVARSSESGLRNAAAILVDARTLELRALVGSADFTDASIHGQVNGVTAKRSPGSVLKPFIYALAIDQGLIHAQSVLKDAPAAFGAYLPENFDQAFVGPLSASEALTRSRNVPAVSLAARLTQPSYYQFLKTAGVSRMASERHYGLALALGGGEATLEEVATLYAMLLNRGELRPIRVRQDNPRPRGVRLLSAAASFMVLDMLAGTPRPDGSPARGKPVAWKTGTSWGFRDAWTAGAFGPYVLVVWVGNFDGRGDPALVGARAAAPLFFSIVEALQASLPEVTPGWTAPPGLETIEVCLASGDLPNADCPRNVRTWYIPGRSPIRVSDLHRRVTVDVRDGTLACPTTLPRYRREVVVEYWPSDLMQLYAAAGMPRRSPPAPGRCSQVASEVGEAPRILSPLQGVTYRVRAEQGPSDLELSFLASADGDVRQLYWFVDGAFIGSSRPSTPIAWRPRQGGPLALSVVDDHGRSDGRVLRVEIDGQGAPPMTVASH